MAELAAEDRRAGRAETGCEGTGGTGGGGAGGRPAELRRRAAEDEAALGMQREET